MLEIDTHVTSGVASRVGAQAFLAFMVAVPMLIAPACGGGQGMPSSSPTAEVATPTLTPMPSPTSAGTPIAEAEGCLASADRIAYADEGGDLWFVNSDGADAIRATQSGDNSELVFSPDGKKVAYIHRVGSTRTGGAILDIRVVFRQGSAFREAVVQEPMPTFVRELGQFVAPDNLRWTTDGTSVLAHIAFGGVSQHYIGGFPVDSDVEPYFLGGPGGEPTTQPIGQVQLWVYEFDIHPLTGEIAFVMYSNASPVGYYLSVAEPNGSNDRYVLPPSAIGQSYLMPSWSPVTQDIAYYAVGADGAYSVAVVNSEPSTGVATPRQLAAIGSVEPTDRPRWSPDRKQLAYDDGSTVWVVDLAGTSEPRKLAEGTHPSWSPDGTELVYESAGGIWIIAAGGGEPGQVASGSGPEWSPAASVCGESTAAAPSTASVTPSATASPTATPTATSTTPAVDARSVPIELLLRPGAEVQKVLYASFDDALPEEIVVYSSLRYVPDNPDCAAQPYLDVFAYDQQGQGWGKVFDAVEGPDAVIPDLRSQYETGVVCAIGYWIDPLELMDFDGDGKQELLVRVGGGGGSGNPGDIRVLGFEGAGLELRARKLLQAWLWKAQDVVVASQGELWLEQVITSKWEPVGHAAAVLRGVVRYDKNQQAITIVDQEARLLCTEGTVTAKAQDLLTLSCESNEVPGLMDPYPAQLDFSVDPLTRFDPKPAVNSLEDVQIGDHVRIEATTLGLSAGGLTPEWVFVDGAWTVPGASYASPVAGLVEVVSAP